MQPETTYARTPAGYIAYQVLGERAPDILYVGHWGNNVDVMWEDPDYARWLRGIGSFGRLITFDKRGHGSSDPLPKDAGASLEHFHEDINVVMDAARSSRAILIAEAHATPVVLTFAATYPERTSAIIIVNGFARFLRDEDYPWGLPTESVPALLGATERTWGTGEQVVATAPSRVADRAFRTWYGRYQRLAMAPSHATKNLGAFLLRTDVRSVLPSIRVPTLVLHRGDCLHVPVAHGRYLAEHIPGARFVELAGTDTLIFTEGVDEMLVEIGDFVGGVRETADADRVLATVLFTDLVDSTGRAAALGDRGWRDVLDRHDRVARAEVERHRGRLIKTTGDGVLATFDAPARAIRCALAIRDGVSALGVEVRAGLHTGEIELRGEDVGGMAVNIASRVADLAGANEVLASRTVADLVVGSGIEFSARGEQTLKGVPGEWRLFAVHA